MQYQFEKVIAVIDDHGDMTGIIVHDSSKHTKKFYKLKELGMEEILSLFEPNAKIKEHVTRKAD